MAEKQPEEKMAGGAAGFGAPEREVAGHFDRAAGHYDLMNDIMSAGLHHVWKNALLNWLEAPRAGEKPYRLLDLACGSGDLAQGFLRLHRTGKVILADPNLAMLTAARRRLAAAPGMTARAAIAGADGVALPFARCSFEACIMGFGIRNIARRMQALAEIHRVLKPGGRFLCLEFTPAPAEPLRPFYEFYLTRIIPALGAHIAGEKEAYAYLARSIRRFPPPAQFAAGLCAGNFSRVRWRLLSGGVVAIFSAWRL